MKTLIINGSPRRKNTNALISELKKYLNGEIIELNAFQSNIEACNNCEGCHRTGNCVKKDDMQIIYNDDFDNIIIASPVYMHSLTPPLFTLASRLQSYYVAKRFLKIDLNLKPKQGVLILTGGGDGTPDQAISLSTWMFKKLNASFDKERDYAFSLQTDTIPASQDLIALEKVREIADNLNKGYSMVYKGV